MINAFKNLHIGFKIGTLLIAILICIWMNPFAYNKPTERTIVTGQFGGQDCIFKPGVFWAGSFATLSRYPNQVGVEYKDSVENLELEDNTVDIGRTKITFLGGASATVTGIAQFNLPNDKDIMIDMHNNHKTIEGLVRRRLAPYVKECLGQSAQLLTPEAHYSGGKAQMKQDYLDQLRDGSYLLNLEKVQKYDSMERTTKSEYLVKKRFDKQNKPERSFSSIKQYQIGVGDAQITNVEYEPRIVNMLGQQIDAQTNASVARQKLVTAQQQALTAAAVGQKELVEIEYQQKKAQTTQTVQAQTKVELAKLYSTEQEEAAKAAVFAAKKIKIDADAQAYQNRQLRDAGLTAYEKADFELQEKKAYYDAIGKITLPTNYFTGSNSSGTSDLINALLANKLIDK